MGSTKIKLAIGEIKDRLSNDNAVIERVAPIAVIEYIRVKAELFNNRRTLDLDLSFEYLCSASSDSAKIPKVESAES